MVDIDRISNITEADAVRLKEAIENCGGVAEVVVEDQKNKGGGIFGSVKKRFFGLVGSVEYTSQTLEDALIDLNLGAKREDGKWVIVYRPTLRRPYKLILDIIPEKRAVRMNVRLSSHYRFGKPSGGTEYDSGCH